MMGDFINRVAFADVVHVPNLMPVAILQVKRRQMFVAMTMLDMRVPMVTVGFMVQTFVTAAMARPVVMFKMFVMPL
ncbi:MAG TPA: hypothetical protein V6D22_24770 [Candidatus Obscuribacterales bacterium]